MLRRNVCSVAASTLLLVGMVACQGDSSRQNVSDASSEAAPFDATSPADSSIEAPSEAMADAAADATVESGADGPSAAVESGADGPSAAVESGAADGPSDAGAGLAPGCASAAIGPAGGKVIHPKGAQVIVPVGALDATTQLAVCSVATAPSGAVGTAFELQPEGRTFYLPVQVVLPFDPTLLSAGTDLTTVQVQTAPQAATTFVALQSSVDLSTSVVRTTTTHFSQFVAAQTSNPVFISSASSLPPGTVGTAYSQQFAATGGTPPYQWSVSSSTTLPPGLSLSSAGALSGAPSAPGNFAFFVQVSDAANDSVQMAVSLTVNPPANPVPSLGGVAPSSAAQGGVDTTITLSGSGFVPVSQVLWDGTPLSTTFVGATQVAATVPANDLLGVGTHQVSVSNPPPGGGTSSSVTFTVTPSSVALNPVPSIASVTPTQLPVSSVDTQVTIAGSNFVAASSAVIGSQQLSTNYNSPTQLLAIIPAAYLSSAGALQIGVSNPAPGGGVSPTTLTVTVGTVGPATLTALMPSSVLAGSGDLTLTLSGSGFVTGAQTFFGGTSLATTVLSTTTAQVTVSASLLTQPGSLYVTMANPPGGGITGALTFVINPVGDAGSGEGGCTEWPLACINLVTAAQGTPTTFQIDLWSCDHYPWNEPGGNGPMCRTTASWGIPDSALAKYGLDGGAWCCCGSSSSCGCALPGETCGNGSPLCCTGTCSGNAGGTCL